MTDQERLDAAFRKLRFDATDTVLMISVIAIVAVAFYLMGM